MLALIARYSVARVPADADKESREKEREKEEEGRGSRERIAISRPDRWPSLIGWRASSASKLTLLSFSPLSMSSYHSRWAAVLPQTLQSLPLLPLIVS